MTETPEEILRVKYHVPDMQRLEYTGGKGDWIDLRSAEDVEMSRGDFRFVSLGISVQLPAGYEMLIAARSSTFRNFGLIQTNAVGIVDESYCSDEDVLMWPCYATRDTHIRKGDRICQFRILRHQPHLVFREVDTLGNTPRGGFGSTGIA